MSETQVEKVGAELAQGRLLRSIGTVIRRLGPGIITGASDDDPSTIGTFAQTGAQFGYTQLWLLLFTFPMMAAVQEMCARIGLVTGEGLSRVIRHHYPRPVLYVCVLLLLIANTINVGADLGAMAASGQLLFNLPFIVWLLGFTLLSAGLEIFTDYQQYSRILRLFTFALFTYVLVAFVVPQNWAEAFKSTLVPTLSFNKDYMLNLVALLGTAISPYLYFWQTSEEVEEKIKAGEVREEVDEGKIVEEAQPGVSPAQLAWTRLDVTAGMFFANVVGWFMVVTTASTLHRQGITNITSAVQAAQALKPVAGDFAFLLFALGMIGTGLLSVPVLAGSMAYAIAGALNLREGLYWKPFQALGFYGIIALCTLVGAGMNLIGINPIQALYYTSVINGVVAPPLLLMVMLISNNRKIMQDQVNGRLSNLLGWLTTIAMTVSAAALLVSLGS